MPKTTIPSIHADLAPHRSRETLPCSQTHAWSDRSDGYCVRQTTVYEVRGRGARRRTSGCPRTLGDARPHRVAQAAGTRGDPASWWAHRAVSEADGLVQLVCCAVRAARAATTVAVLLQHRASAASALHKAAAGRARTGAAVGALGSTWLSSAASGASSSITCRVRYTDVHVSSVSTWPTGMATWPGWDGRFTPFLRMWPRALMPAHACWTRQPAPTLSA